MKKLVLLLMIIAMLATNVYAEGFLEHIGVIGTLGADSLTNIDIGRFEGKQADYRFTASHTGNVEAVTIFLIYKIPGYAAGDGGDILVELKTDDGNGYPSEEVLASYLIEDPMAENFPVIYFDQTAHLEEGEVYHIEFSNPAPDPVNNYVGVDVIFDARREANSQPHYTDDDYAVLWKPSGQYDWQLSEGTIPVFSVHFTDGRGQGIGYMDAFAKWEVDRYYITGDEQIRETMEFPADKTIDSMNVRVKKVDESGPLTVTLENDETVLQECIFAAEEIEPDRDWSGQDFDHNMVWAGCDFEPTTLLAGETYNLVLKSTDGNYFTVGVQDGAHIYNFHPDSVFDEGDFQYSLDGGDNWEEYRHSDVQFYFTMTDPVPVCIDDDGDGYYLEADCDPVDCDDNDNTLTEEITYYADNDGDGLGDQNSPADFCANEAPSGYVNNNNDDNDAIDNNMDNIVIINTTSSGIPHMVNVLESIYNIDVITIEELMQEGIPVDTPVVIWPGGVSFLSMDYIEYNTFPFEVYIDPQITSNLQSHVNSGGGFVGVCAGSIVGAALLETDVNVQDIYPSFPFPVTITEVEMAELIDVNAIDYLEWYDNYAYQNNDIGTLSFNNHPIIGDYEGGYIDYFGGPVFNEYNNVEVIATFTQQLQPALYTTVGEPAIVVQDNVVLSSVHPEYDTETQPVFLRMVQYANGELDDVECTNDNDCDNGYSCQNYECVYDPDCENDADCDTGYTCDNYVCIFNPECEDDNECDQHYSCQNYECVFNPECTNDYECDDQLDYTDNTCESYVCVYTLQEGMCYDVNDCGDGLDYTGDSCENNICTYTLQEGSCYDAINCDDQLDFTDDTCEANTCTYTLQEGMCYDINDCGDGLDYTDDTCENNACVYTLQEGMCYDATNCDDQLDFTDDSCDNNVCTYSLQEEACYDTNDCDNGYECLNNICSFVEPECVDNDGDNYFVGEDCSPEDCDDTEVLLHEPLTFYADNDGDGLGNPDESIAVCSLNPLEGYVDNNLDDDDNPVEYLSYEISGDNVDNDGDGIIDEYNTLAENGEHPEYGDNNPRSRSLYSQSVFSVEGIEDGDIRVTYTDNAIYVYDIFDVTTNENTKFYSSGPRGNFYILHPTDRKISLANVYNGDVSWTINLRRFVYNWLDSRFYTEI